MTIPRCTGCGADARNTPSSRRLHERKITVYLCAVCAGTAEASSYALITVMRMLLQQEWERRKMARLERAREIWAMGIKPRLRA